MSLKASMAAHITTVSRISDYKTEHGMFRLMLDIKREASSGRDRLCIYHKDYFPDHAEFMLAVNQLRSLGYTVTTAFRRPMYDGNCLIEWGDAI